MLNNKLVVFLFILFIGLNAAGHPMPHSILSLNPQKEFIEAQLQIPVKELQLAIPFDISSNTSESVKKYQKRLEQYIYSHLKLSSDSKIWSVLINKISVNEDEQPDTSPYKELTVKLKLVPPDKKVTDNIILDYDGVIHQVVTHKIFVNLTNDWRSGQISPSETTIGIIELDIANNAIHPLSISLGDRGWWKGFKTMVKLGMHHISEGADHLLFLFVLLLIAPMRVENKRWSSSNNLSFSLKNILKITLSFTVGHSLTLLLATFNLITIPSNLIEILIAISILITAINALLPIFNQKEFGVAFGFGLIHGMAFSNILKDLKLDSSDTLLSLLGFNAGIEIMQIILIFMVMPWLLYLSSYKIYNKIRIIGSFITIAASLIWLAERITQNTNIASAFLESATKHSILIIPILLILSVYSYFSGKIKILK